MLKVLVLILILLSINLQAQDKTPPVSTPFGGQKAPSAEPAASEDPVQKPNGRRIRRQLNLVVGLSHDEELLIPDRETVLKGRTDFFDIQRITGTDYFRITPKKSGSGIATLHDRRSGQILVEIRFDIRDDSSERTLREIQALLGDIEGIEFKLINPRGNETPAPPPVILIDGYVLLPKDLIRIFQVTAQYGPDRVRTLVNLSPIARQRIANFIAADVNNPEVKITAVGDYIKMEGQVNSEAEKTRIKSIVSLYLPDLVTDNVPSGPTDSVKVVGRKSGGTIDSLIVDLITVKKDDEKVEPPPKLIQVVAHFVKFNDGYSKSFNFRFSPAVSAQGGTSGQITNTIDSTINLLNNLLPKLQWAKFHGFAKLLDTASILVQDRVTGSVSRFVTTGITRLVNGQPENIIANMVLSVTPSIKSERSGLVELRELSVQVTTSGKTELSNNTSIRTTISVRDRQSAAFGGIIKKGTDTNYGAPATEDAIITFNASKEYARINSQFVVFVTPIIKSSASTGVEQVKKKFRLRD